jgi:hypothetical protein
MIYSGELKALPVFTEFAKKKQKKTVANSGIKEE